MIEGLEGETIIFTDKDEAPEKGRTARPAYGSTNAAAARVARHNVEYVAVTVGRNAATVAE